MQTYFLHSPATGHIKIGRSRDVASRVRSLRTASSDNIELLGVLDGDRELELHAQFADTRIRGEWFKLSVELAEYLKRAFNCILPDAPVDLGSNRAPVETWPHIIHRAELAFGSGLLHGDHDEFTADGYAFFDGLRAAQRAADRARFGETEQPTGHDPEDDVSEEADEILYGLADWWPWVRGWNFVGETDDRAAAILLLFQKPGNAPKLEDLCRDVARFGADAFSLDVDLRVAIATRQRTESNEWIGEVMGPATIDDEADIWGATRGVLCPILIDHAFGFRLLGDAWYSRSGLPTPAEGGLPV